MNKYTSTSSVPFTISQLFKNAALYFGGILFLIGCAQIIVPLPHTVVPMTGQTFGVFLIALNFTPMLSFLTVGSYLIMGMAGLPVFAGASALSLAVISPTLGYLYGMLISSFVVSYLKQLFSVKGLFGLALLACTQHLLVMGLGLYVLSFFVAKDFLLQSGYYPFIAGDLLKSALAISLTLGVRKLSNR